MSKGKQNIIAGLDIGSNMVRMAVGQMVYRNNDDTQAEMQILGATEVPSEGMHKGSINSIEDLVSAVSSCLEKMERTVGLPIDRVWTGVSGLHIMSQNSKGVVAVSKADSEISETDVERALEAARSISTPLNYEVLHVLPKRFSVDGQTGIKDPVGMTGIRLEVDAQIILGASAQIKNLTKAIYRSGLEIEDLVLSILASSEAAVTNRQKDLGVAVVDFGASTTSLAVYEEGEILHSTILPIGSEHITNDIAIGLRTAIDVAERVKIEYGDCFSNTVSKKEEIDLYELGAGEHENVKRKYLSEIIEARVEEIMQKIDDELRKVGRSGMLPSGVVFTGGGAKLPGITEAAKKYLRLPATLGYPLNFISATDKINDLGFVNVVGLLKWGSMMSVGHGTKNAKLFDGLKKVGGSAGALKDWFKALLP
ncbi:MAG: cell division protein FtsA [Candidatus Magasanikbacteria bacterium]|nr:cell division protein FtsA [Candidatus Magasanikbacteria bacterium]